VLPLARQPECAWTEAHETTCLQLLHVPQTPHHWVAPAHMLRPLSSTHALSLLAVSSAAWERRVPVCADVVVGCGRGRPFTRATLG
jgi:hypothetical protein